MCVCLCVCVFASVVREKEGEGRERMRCIEGEGEGRGSGTGRQWEKAKGQQGKQGKTQNVYRASVVLPAPPSRTATTKRES